MQRSGQEPSWWSGVIVFLTVAAAFKMLAATVADPDLWGHILFGQRTLELGAVERTDPFSYLTSGKEWINHEWLSEVIFAAVFDLGGGAALTLLRLFIALTIVGLVLRRLLRHGLDPLRAGLVVVPMAMLLIPGLSTVRPQMFTYLGFALTLLILASVEEGHPRRLWLVPPLLAVWINFHGGVLAGVGILGIWGLAKGVQAAVAARANGAGELASLRAPLAVGAVSAGALLLNPYGAGLPAFLLRTGTVPRPDIMEWRALDIASGPGLLYLAAVVLAAFTLTRSRAGRNPALLAPLAVLVLLPLTAVRHVQLLAIGYPILLAGHFPSGWGRARAEDVGARGVRRILVTSALLAAALLTLGGLRDVGCIRIDPDRSIAFPVRAVEWLRRSEVSANLAVYFDWGEYAIWHLHPRVRVSMDGRRETVYPDSIYQEYLRFQNGIGTWRDVLDKHPTDLVLAPRNRPTFNLMRSQSDWEMLYEDPLGAVFARRDGALIRRLRATPVPDGVPFDGAGSCVP